ncbi:MAG TPA: DsbA family protein [Thermohalobaculum sp.]|nr:DsbA family protein [Thermohalobaculum sp.]
MPMTLDRRRFLAVTGAAGALAALPLPALAEPVMGDIALGADDAPVTVIEYASFTCPHCAAFHQQTWPKVKADYVDAGKVRFILREVYFDRYGLWASMVARCGGEQAFYPLAEAFLMKQDSWASVPEEQIGLEIAKIGRLNGLSNEQLDACLSDEDYARSLIEQYQANAGEHDVRSTPTFIINGDKHTGNLPYEEFAQLLDAEL